LIENAVAPITTDLTPWTAGRSGVSGLPSFTLAVSVAAQSTVEEQVSVMPGSTLPPLCEGLEVSLTRSDPLAGAGAGAGTGELRLKVAVRVSVALTVTWQVLWVVAQPPPDQPANVEPGAGVSLSVS
jgi:hypothetical protein